MRFSQLDKIVSLEKGTSITAVKCLSLSEEYLQDHFPRFPVMPGVLMVESMFQASMFLVRATADFKYSTVVLKGTKSLKFQGFVRPGDQFEVVSEIKSTEGSLTHLKVKGLIDGVVASSGRLVLDSYNLAEREGVDPMVDKYMIREFRLTFRKLCNQLEQSNLSAMTELSEVATTTNNSRVH